MAELESMETMRRMEDELSRIKSEVIDTGKDVDHILGKEKEEKAMDMGTLMGMLMNGKKEGMTAGEALALCKNNGFGDGNGWWIILLFLFMFWGGGFGGFGNRGNASTAAIAAEAGITNCQYEALMNAINGNTNVVRDIASAFQLPLQNVQDKMNTLQNTMEACCGQLGMTQQQILGAIQNNSNIVIQAFKDNFCAMSKEFGDLAIQAERNQATTNLGLERLYNQFSKETGIGFASVIERMSNFQCHVDNQFAAIKEREDKREIECLKAKVGELELGRSQAMQTARLEQYMASLVAQVQGNCGCGCGTNCASGPLGTTPCRPLIVATPSGDIPTARPINCVPTPTASA